MLTRGLCWLPLAASLAITLACDKGTPGSRVIKGAGASFPQALYAKWISTYLAHAPAAIVHLPMTLGAVVVTYNLPKSVSSIRLTADVLADVYLGIITKWNDRRVVELNPALAATLGGGGTVPGKDGGLASREAGAPDLSIGVAHRSNGSGTTAVFTDYLSRVSSSWRDRAGAGTSVNWPTGIGVKGNDGVGEFITSTPGAIGYAELVFSSNKNLPTASLRNHMREFVEPADASIIAAAASLADRFPEDMCVSLVDSAEPLAYPLATFSYVLVYADNPDDTKARETVRFLAWGAVDGQKYGAALHYTALPSTIAARVIAKLHTLTANGKLVL